MQEELGALRALTRGSGDCGSAQEGALEDGFGIGEDLKPRQICWQGFLSGRQKRTGERESFVWTQFGALEAGSVIAGNAEGPKFPRKKGPHSCPDPGAEITFLGQ